VQAALGDAAAGIESLSAAAKLLESLQSLQPDATSVRSALATTNGRRGDVHFDNQQIDEAESAYKDARRRWKELVEASPSAEYLHRAAWLETTCPLESVRDAGLALEYARRAAEAAPENRFYLGTLAAAHARAGQSQEALDRITPLLAGEAAADRGRDLLFLAMCHHQLGRADDARDSFNKAADWIKENRPGNAGLKRLRDEVSRLIDAPNETSGQPAAAAAN
jgi:tetratricopeptide (TPR) repeat protein